MTDSAVAAAATLDARFLVGPTAVGKSAVAHWLAERHGRDIVSADSMQVYRGMDIGTAKPAGEERRRVRYFGLDLVEPAQAFNLWEFRSHALEAIAAGRQAGRETLVVGGSGLYVKSLTDGLSTVPPANAGRRAHWENVFQTHGAVGLRTALHELNPAMHDALPDKENPRRLLRAIELAEGGASALPSGWKASASYAPLAGLDMPQAALKLGIELRVRGMYRSGLVDEVRGLLARYPELSPTARQAIGYAEAIDVLQGRCAESAAVARTVTRTCQLAKRQRTWFRRQANVHWIMVEPGLDVQALAAKIVEYWNEAGPTRIAN